MKKWEKIEEWFRCLVIRGLRLIQQTRYKKTRSSVFCNYAIIIILYYIILLYYIIILYYYIILLLILLLFIITITIEFVFNKRQVPWLRILSVYFTLRYN